MLENSNTMWVKPTADVCDIQAIWDYALTVNGYDYSVQQFGIECGELANERAHVFSQTGVWQGSFEELRCCLFFEQRRWRHFGIDPEGNQLLEVQKLYLAVSQQWQLESGDSLLPNSGESS